MEAAIRHTGGPIEREAELGVLARSLAAVEGGDGAMVVLEGSAGIGKTRLLSEARILAEEAGVTTFVARGGELESAVTFGLVRQLFERRLARMAPAEREDVLSGAAALAMSALEEPSVAVDGVSVEHGLYWLVANLAEHEPVVLLVDDVHWADGASLRFLVYLARRLEGLAVLLVVATRPPQPGVAGQMIELLAREPAATVMRIEALSEDGSARLLAGCLGCDPAPAAARVSHISAGGNPFFLVEIASALAEAGIAADDGAVEHIRALVPTAVSRALLLRLGRLGEPACAVAEALSVLGARGSLTDLEVVSGRDRDAVLAALEQLSGAGLTSPGAQIVFSHPIVRHAIYGDLSAARRWRMHERAVRALSARRASPEHIAQHLLQTEPGGDPAGVAILRAVGARALSSGDAPAAARMLARATHEPLPAAERPQLLVELGEAQGAAGDVAAAVTTLREALAAAPSVSLRVRGALALASALAAGEGTAPAVDMLHEQARLLDGEAALRLDVEQTTLAVWVEQLAAAAALRMREFETFAGVTPAERIGLANASLGVAYDPAGSAERAVDLARRALSDGALVAEGSGAFLVAEMAAYVLAMGEDFDGSDREHVRLTRVARERGLGWLYAQASLLPFHTALARGELARAAAYGETTWEGLRVIDDTAVTQRALSFAGSYLTETLLLRGDLDAARALMRTATDAEYFERPELVWLRYGRGLLRLRDGDAPGALEDLEAYGAAARAGGYEDRGTHWRLAAARAHTALGGTDAAITLADEQLALARTWGAPAGLGRALRARAALEGRDGGEMLQDAIEILRSSQARLELAGALVDSGSVLRRCSRRTEARARLEEGMDLAARCEAMPLAQFAHSELRVLGARPRRLMFSGIEALTATERRVAEMAATGLSNREVAQALFVSRRTVENHLSHVYTKLDISSREQLPPALTPDL